MHNGNNYDPYEWPTFDNQEPRYSHHQGWWLDATDGWDNYVTACTPWRLHSFTIDVWFKMYLPDPAQWNNANAYGGIAGNLFFKPTGGAAN